MRGIPHMQSGSMCWDEKHEPSSKLSWMKPNSCLWARKCTERFNIFMHSYHMVIALFLAITDDVMMFSLHWWDLDGDYHHAAPISQHEALHLYPTVAQRLWRHTNRNTSQQKINTHVTSWKVTSPRYLKQIIIKISFNCFIN